MKQTKADRQLAEMLRSIHTGERVDPWSDDKPAVQFANEKPAGPDDITPELYQEFFGEHVRAIEVDPSEVEAGRTSDLPPDILAEIWRPLDE